MKSGQYHHGDLRRAVLTAAAERIATSGVAALRLRELARDAGVSHTAPTHHFKDLRGLLTALATEGYQKLAQALTDAGEDLLEAGVAYVDFAIRNPGHFEVMFQPNLYHADDPDIAAARERTWGMLRGRTPGQSEDESLAAWSIVHGYAQLWRSGAISQPGVSAAASARGVIRRLFESSF